MKRLIYVLVLFLVSCQKKESRTYEIIYQNGDKEIVNVIMYEGTTALMLKGDFFIEPCCPLRSGVRTYYRIKNK